MLILCSFAAASLVNSNIIATIPLSLMEMTATAAIYAAVTHAIATFVVASVAVTTSSAAITPTSRW